MNTVYVQGSVTRINSNVSFCLSVCTLCIQDTDMEYCKMCQNTIETDIPLVFNSYHPDPDDMIWIFEVWECPECGCRDFVLILWDEKRHMEILNDRLPY